jgi:hypothetical protein
VNTHTSAENQIKEFGILRVYNQQFFNDLNTKYGIDLENLVYYRGETHYFVMTAMIKRYDTLSSSSHQHMQPHNAHTHRRTRLT